MVRSARMLLLALALGGTVATAARAQTPPPPQPVAPLDATATTAPPPQMPGPPPLAGAPAPTFDPAPLPGPYFVVDPLLDRPPLLQPGWFADLDIGGVIPHVKNHLNGPVQLGFIGPTQDITVPTPDTVALHSAGLDWTVFPRIEAGYRLPSGFGGVALSYRFLDTEGNGTAAGMDGVAALHSRLDLQEIGLDYTSDETSLWPNWDMKWAVGLRMLWVYFDSRADESPQLAAAGSTVFEQQESNWYAGFGPHLGLELDRQIACTGLSFVLRADGAIYLGRLQQRFSEASTALAANGAPLIGVTREGVSQGVPVLGGFVGFRWQPTQWKGAEFYLGYQYEHWWDIARNNETISFGELNVQGIFVRAGFNF
ncbi:MAG TPA: Lpg1974 family pore-forming outer membrane protein [Gemmataceae bacterium]|nr:Lpg1974 family pore-forming outer membrane protein [Gemmataceae bacterium]